ncbi:EAL domain-containing protein [Rummeliibacillus suwonensis]|uniref:EAL domain-containing protein n=1 Tax=Rummeliibacillus suwonensis TaxID=1306154 RepID=UPI0028A0E10A|nr:EAL domain-containing protein [Rummeliibacillus suwonensis]
MHFLLNFEDLPANFFSYVHYLFNRRHENLLDYKRYHELKRILKNEKLDTFFQPIVDLKTSETFGFEALNRPTKSHLFSTTDAFYDFVGTTNMIFEFEKFCRNLSLQRYVARLNKETIIKKHYTLFLNIHPSILLDKNYHMGETMQLLNEMGVQPNQIVFELTERSAVTDYREFERVLSNYRSQGYRIAIDDVGSGYNSLKTLIYLRPEFIKLDCSLIQSIHQNDAAQKLVSLIYEYATQSNTKIIAEGIEQIEEIAYLQSIGIHFGQGYALGKPKTEITDGSIPNR